MVVVVCLQLALELRKKLSKQPSRRSSHSSDAAASTSMPPKRRANRVSKRKATKQRRKTSSAAAATLDFFHQSTLNASNQGGAHDSVTILSIILGQNDRVFSFDVRRFLEP